ncbi:4'-phosphopantetheinyl transferase family protein [Streptomyces meridianus]|uniref:4'-phosphopantetheinyl transferase superfamily protein n=1 Tax=Streptomyces meridianus TaxID=2938945 RepID=A0ABT0XAM7_9ACTN|nr:4'-phosphopantetheinyl transferase superfamily protein [Streptomyces meridianus]MCM2579586.1 4'-phosphopantetheinyl transferase superfamily protein [Streptomyces meridianus]
MIRELLPGSVQAEERFGDPAVPGMLYAEEELLIAKALPSRRAEFTTVRACAREALQRIGAPRTPLLRGDFGAPVWPTGVVGSMTHCVGYRAAAVARASDVTAVGIDAEPNLPLRDDGVLGLVALAQERVRLPTLAAQRPDVCWDRLVFSAKESVYKAWYPLARRFLDFHEAEILFDLVTGSFTARLLIDGPVVRGRRLKALSGRWAVRDGLILTATLLETPASDRARTPADEWTVTGRRCTRDEAASGVSDGPVPSL